MVERKIVKTIGAGSVGGIVSTVLCHPLDTIRTRLQTQRGVIDGVGGDARYRGAMDCFVKMVRQEGVSSLYKGVAGPLAAQALYKAVMFGAFGYSSEKIGLANVEHQGERVGKVFACGVFAGCINSFFVCPIELVRNRLMVQRNVAGSAATSGRPIYVGTIDCIKQTVRGPHGVLGLWKGLTSTILRDSPGVGMWFASFEQSKYLLHKYFGLAKDSTLNLIVSGSMGGVGFWLIALPFDTIKSNIQTSHKRELTIMDVIRLKGIRGLYTGLGVALLRGIPGAGVVFLVQKRALQFFETL